MDYVAPGGGKNTSGGFKVLTIDGHDMDAVTKAYATAEKNHFLGGSVDRGEYPGCTGHGEHTGSQRAAEAVYSKSICIAMFKET